VCVSGRVEVSKELVLEAGDNLPEPGLEDVDRGPRHILALVDVDQGVLLAEDFVHPLLVIKATKGNGTARGERAGHLLFVELVVLA
jgi:hypothetical protein